MAARWLVGSLAGCPLHPGVGSPTGHLLVTVSWLRGVRFWQPPLLAENGFVEAWERELAHGSLTVLLLLLLLPWSRRWWWWWWWRMVAVVSSITRSSELVVALVLDPLGRGCECQGRLCRSGRDGQRVPQRVVEKCSLALRGLLSLVQRSRRREVVMATAPRTVS